MAKERNALKSGIFILVTVAAIVGIIVAIKGIRDLSEPKAVHAASFALTSNLNGLGIGDDVRVGGYKVGAVQSIAVVGVTEAETKAGERPRIRVTYTFPRRYVVHRDAVLRIDSGLTGGTSLNFENLGRAEPLSDAEELTGRPGGFQEALAMLQEAGPSLQGILHNVDRKTIPAVNEAVGKFARTADSFTTTGESASGLLGEVRVHVGPVMDKYYIVADRAAEMMVKIRDLFGDTTTDIRTTMSNVAAVSGSLKDRTPQIVDRLNNIMVRIDSTVESANVALQDVKTVAINARELSTSAKGVLVGNKGKLDGMIASLKTASDNLKNATAEIRRSPWRLLYKPAAGEMANLNLYDAAREFSEGASNLNDASLALRDALQSKDIDKETLQKLMEKVDKTFTHFNNVEQKLWVKVQE